MALPNPSMSFTPFDPLTAAQLNDFVENDQALSNGTAITNMATNVTSISNPYKFSVYLTADQTIPDQILTKVTFDTEFFDTNNNFDAVTNHRYTAPVTGYYQVNSYVIVVSSASTGVAGILALYKNGSEIRRQDMGNPSTSSTATVLAGTIAELVSLAAGDYIEIYGYLDVNSGTARVAGTSTAARFSGFLVSQT